MKSSTLRQDLEARLKAALPNWNASDALIGVGAMPRTKLTPAFEVELLGAETVGDRQRVGGTTRLRRRFVVRLLHAASPSQGVHQWDVALSDEARARSAVQRRDPTNEANPLRYVENTIVWLGTDDPELLGGGEFRRTTIRFHIDYSEELD